MSQCPLCHASVQDDFGLIECGGCGAQLIVHMDGRVEYQGAQDSPPPPDEVEDDPPREGLGFSNSEPIFEIDEETQMREAADFAPPGTTGKGYRMPEDDSLEEPPPPPVADLEIQDQYLHDQPSEFESAEEAEEGNLEEPEAAAFQEGESAGDDAPADEAPPEAPPEDAFFDDNAADSEPPPAVYNSAPNPGSPDLSDVANFGNSDLSGSRDGSLRYNLFIEGIDTSDVREAFREALTDRKLMWDIDQILRGVRNGRVNIPNVAPTKAYILISRLRGMPVQVRWEQYAISQT